MITKAMKRTALMLVVVLCLSMIISGMTGASETSTIAKSVKKPVVSASKSVTLNEGETRTFSIKSNGFKIKSVKSVPDNLSFVSVKSSKKKLSITGMMKGSTTVTTTIKAKRGKKTKTFKTKTTVKINEVPFSQSCTGDVNVKIIDPKTIKIAFSKVVDYINQTQVRIHTSDGSQVIIAEGGISSTDCGKTHTLSLIPPGIISGEIYTIDFIDRDEQATFSYKKKPTYVCFKDGVKKSFKKIPFSLGGKIGALPLAANPYNQAVKYSISGGKDKTCFDVDENGNLIWHKTNGITPGLKKFEVEVTAETEQTEILEGASATIMCTVTLK